MGNKDISTLVSDIEDLLVKGIDLKEVPEETINNFGKQLATTITNMLVREERKPTLRMSNIGKKDRQLWYELNEPEHGEKFRPETYLKFGFGHILEDLLLFLAELAGHKVTGRQDVSEIEGVKGHRDGVVSGMLIDVKSASSYSFKKFQSHGLKDSDPFGYIPQIQSYLHAGQDDPQIQTKDKAGFLVVDKTLGHLTLDIHEKDDNDWPEIYRQKKEMVKGPIPDRCYEPVPMGASGNMKLGMPCSYCNFNKRCWPEMRTFLYANGPPVHLVVVKKTPLVPELLEPQEP